MVLKLPSLEYRTARPQRDDIIAIGTFKIMHAFHDPETLGSLVPWLNESAGTSQHPFISFRLSCFVNKKTVLTNQHAHFFY